MTAPPVILDLDLATQVGWCAGDGTSQPVVDSFRLPATGGDLGRFGHEARAYFRILLTRFQPDLVVYEAPVSMSNQTPEVTTKLHAMPLLLELTMMDLGLKADPVMVYPVTIKKRLSGNGRAKKPEMLRAATELGFAPKNFDEADACGAWLCGLHEQSPRLASRWDRLALTGLRLDLP